MMSNCNSPLLDRASPFRANSVDRGDAYQLEKDLVIGELTSRMKGRVRNFRKTGFDKDKRGETDEDFPDEDFVDSPSSSRRCKSAAAASACDEEEDVQQKVVLAAPTATAKINPQRVSTATINLAPSPRVTRRNRSKSPNGEEKMSRGMTQSASASAYLNMSNNRAFSRSNSAQPRTQNSSRRPLNANSGLNSAGGSRNSINSCGSSSSNMKSSASYNSLNKTSNRHPGFNRSVSSNPSLGDPSIAAKIGNRATKVVQKSIGKCGACGKAINEDGCTAFGKVYHKSCFKCTVCKQKIQGKFFERDGKPYCAKDFQKSLDSCAVCNQPIKGDCVESNSKVFHPECMKCYVCNVSLRGTYFTYQDQPICEMHYKMQADKCSVCNLVPTGKYYSINDRIFCEDCHNDHGEKCPKCKGSVNGKVVKTSNASFHPDCFLCVVCKKNMINVPFISDDKNQVYCIDDYNKKKAPKCSFCKKPIVPKDGQRTAPRLRALDRDFHPQCFQCEDCGLVLDSRVKGKECYPFKNHILCVKCNRKKLSSSEESEEEIEE